MGTGTTMTIPMSTPNPIAEGAAAALYRLIAWTSPAYPTGAFSYSHGLEWAVEDGLVPDRAGLEAWVGHIVERGAGWSDSILFAHAFRAAEAEDWTALDELADLAAALRATAELALESAQQGSAFLTITRAAWPAPRLERLAELRTGRPVPLPIAQAVALAGEVPLPAALASMLGALAANLVSAGVRLVPLGQTDGQRAVAALMPVVARATAAALAASIDDIGTAAPMVDWASMRHETQYTRLFRS
ncbi:urease accessory protein [Stella humosa]|uniref:Urease accessory protein UreF n=2 Tax=Stella humosa TaxID=94 RepID=A0A3N1LK48_9PROT|nr:urease accessory protein [Stella humosa]